MRTRYKIRVAIVTVIFLLSIINYKVEAFGEGRVYYYRLRISFINKGSNDYSLTLKDKLFTLFPNTSIQQVYIVDTDSNVKGLVKDEDGNLFVQLRLPDIIRPSENVTVAILMKITLTSRKLPQISIDSSGSLLDIPIEFANYTISSGVWKYESKDLKYIADIASLIKGNDTNVLRITSKMVEFIGSNVEYPTGEEFRSPQYPNQTLPISGEKGVGDCDDQSALLVAMLRSVGIPSYLQTGGVISTYYSLSGDTWDGHLTISSKGIGWHGWVEAYVPPWGWLPVDITYGYYSQRQNPLSSIIYSASAREPMLESEKYLNIDFIAEYLKTKEGIEKSDLYLYLEEEVYVASPFSDGPHILERFGEIVLVALLVALIALVTYLLIGFRHPNPNLTKC